MFAVIWYYKFIVIWNGTYPVLWDFTYSIFWYFTFIRIPLSDIFDFLLFGFTFLSYKNALQIFFLRFLASYVSYYVIYFTYPAIWYFTYPAIWYFTYPAIWYFSYPTIWYLTFIRIPLSRFPPWIIGMVSSCYLVFYLYLCLVLDFYSYPAKRFFPLTNWNFLFLLSCILLIPLSGI